MANQSRLVAASFSSLALLSSSVSMDNLSYLLATPSPVLDFSQIVVVTSLQSFKSGQVLFLVVSCFRVLSSAFFPLSSVAEALFA